MILKPWIEKPQQLFKELKSSKVGLSSKEAKKRLEEYGPNVVEKQKPPSQIEIFVKQFKNPLVLILIGACIVSLVTGDRLDALVILAILLLNAFLGFFQEYRSQKAADLLREKSALKARVLREGEKSAIPASELVPGDIVLLAQGTIVPADLRLIESKNLLIDESLITGESFAVEKNSAEIKEDKVIPQEMKNMAFMGTNILSGFGIGIVSFTGRTTEIGKTAKDLNLGEEETEFQQGTRRFGNFLVVLTLVFVAFIFVANTFLKPYFLGISPNYLEALLFSLALAVGITPELLPFIITLNLSKAALDMSKKHSIVKKLIAIEDIGNADVLCSDKTGTLTEGKIFLENYLDYQGQTDQRLILYALLTANLGSGNDSNSSLDQAVMDFPAAKEEEKNIARFETIDEAPFDFKKRRNTVLVKKGEEYWLITKGATEAVLAMCSQVLVEGREKLMLEKEKKMIREKYIHLSSEGFRLLALAKKKVGKRDKIVERDEEGLVFLGFLVFSDRPKESALETINQLKKLNVNIKILTGDNEYVAKHVCQAVGLEVNRIINGDALDLMSGPELEQAVGECDIFTKITPEHKLRIIQAIKKNGHTVAFLGDGANDAPALKAADVGISVDSALDVAKQAADIILLRKGLDVLVEAVKDGRRTFGNTMKYIFSTSSSNFGNVFSLAGASLFLPFIPMLPSQVILLNFISDIPYLAVSTDNVDPESLRKPKHWNIKAIGSFMVPFGLVSSLFDFGTFFLLLYTARSLANPTQVFRSGWFLESLATEIVVIYLIRTARSFWKSRPSSILLILGLLSMVSAFVLIYSPLAKVFSFTPIPLPILALIVVLIVIYSFLVEVGKKIYFSRFQA